MDDEDGQRDVVVDREQHVDDLDFGGFEVLLVDAVPDRVDHVCRVELFDFLGDEVVDLVHVEVELRDVVVGVDSPEADFVAFVGVELEVVFEERRLGFVGKIQDAFDELFLADFFVADDQDVVVVFVGEVVERLDVFLDQVVDGHFLGVDVLVLRVVRLLLVVCRYYLLDRLVRPVQLTDYRVREGVRLDLDLVCDVWLEILVDVVNRRFVDFFVVCSHFVLLF